MPSKSHTMFPGFKENSTGNYSSPGLQDNCNISDNCDNEDVRLPQIGTDAPTNSKTDRKANRFFKFSAEKQSFTENLLSFFTGHKEKGHERSQTLPEELLKNGTKVSKDSSTHRRSDGRHGLSNKNDKPTRSVSNQTNNNRQPVRRTDKTRITATTKNDLFRPVTGGSKKNTKGGNIEVESDVGGYENMYKMKQPAGKFNVPRKRSLEISEYIRRENYKYNERTAKQFLFQKWLRSTELDLPEHYPIDHNDPKFSK